LSSYLQCNSFSVLTNIDIVVIVEASSLTTQKNFEDIKKYLAQFLKQEISTSNNNVHFSLTTFAKTMRIIIPLGRHDHSTVNAAIQKILKAGLHAETEIRTELALMEAADMLDRYTPPNGHRRRVIVPILKHGASPKGQQSGFDLIRNVIINLQQQRHDKFQVVPVWIGESPDLIEAIVMASSPKHTNRLLFKNTKELLSPSSVDHLSSSILKGKTIIGQRAAS